MAKARARHILVADQQTCETLKAEIEGIARQITDEVRERCDHRVKNPGFDPSPHLGAELIARAYGLDGPCIVVDAACASSLQALSIGARALQLGEIDMAVVGGASYCKSDSLVLFSQAYSVSASKSCPFDKNATGLVTAEGYIALILKTLDRALADGDRIRIAFTGDCGADPLDLPGRPEILVRDCMYLHRADSGDWADAYRQHGRLDAILDQLRDDPPDHLVLCHLDARYGTPDAAVLIEAACRERRLACAVSVVWPGEQADDIIARTVWNG